MCHSSGGKGEAGGQVVIEGVGDGDRAQNECAFGVTVAGPRPLVVFFLDRREFFGGKFMLTGLSSCS